MRCVGWPGLLLHVLCVYRHVVISAASWWGCIDHRDTLRFIPKFSIEIPLALGTVGGLTKLHPLANLALDILGKPNSEDLMKITAVAGLAQNFAAIKSLITTGIQHGHMKMHLINILNQQKATDKEKEKAIEYFKTNTVSHLKVDLFIKKLRSNE